MERVVLLSLTAALNPTLVAATTLMLLLPNPSRLMLGYWLGAMMTSGAPASAAAIADSALAKPNCVPPAIMF